MIQKGYRQIVIDKAFLLLRRVKPSHIVLLGYSFCSAYSHTQSSWDTLFSSNRQVENLCNLCGNITPLQLHRQKIAHMIGLVLQPSVLCMFIVQNNLQKVIWANFVCPQKSFYIQELSVIHTISMFARPFMGLGFGFRLFIYLGSLWVYELQTSLPLFILSNLKHSLVVGSTSFDVG